MGARDLQVCLVFAGPMPIELTRRRQQQQLEQHVLWCAIVHWRVFDGRLGSYLHLSVPVHLGRLTLVHFGSVSSAFDLTDWSLMSSPAEG